MRYRMTDGIAWYGVRWGRELFWFRSLLLAVRFQVALRGGR